VSTKIITITDPAGLRQGDRARLSNAVPGMTTTIDAKVLSVRPTDPAPGFNAGWIITFEADLIEYPVRTVGSDWTWHEGTREVPEYAPATVATADVWTDRTEQRLRVFRIPGAWIDEHGEIWHDEAPNRHVDEIVPDAPAPTRVQVMGALDKAFKAMGSQGWGQYLQPGTDAVMELLGGAR